MKKIILIASLLLVIWGCNSNEEEINKINIEYSAWNYPKAFIPDVTPIGYLMGFDITNFSIQYWNPNMSHNYGPKPDVIICIGTYKYDAPILMLYPEYGKMITYQVDGNKMYLTSTNRPMTDINDMPYPEVLYIMQEDMD